MIIIKRVTLVIFIIASLFFASLYFQKPSLLQELSFSQALFSDQDHLLQLTTSTDDKYRLFIPLSDISPLMVKATLLQEDQYFHYHFGVNPIALIKAIWKTYAIGERRYGASTITMQLARLRFDLNSRTINGKIRQIIRALQIEMHYSKKEILEAYLNLAPYGGNVEGVGAASYLYFGKHPKQLSLREILTLAVIPQNPVKRNPLRYKINARLIEARDRLWRRWLAQ